MAKISGGNLREGSCLFEGYWYAAGDAFEWKGNVCICCDNGSINCTKKYVPGPSSCSTCNGMPGDNADYANYIGTKLVNQWFE